MNVSLRPDRSLLDSNFESYKLSLSTISVERLPVANGVFYLDSPDVTSKQHIKAFSNQNCLTCDPYSPGTVYYMDGNGSIVQLLITGDDSGIGSTSVKFTVENWRQQQSVQPKVQPTFKFPSSWCCCLYDGIGSLVILKTNLPSHCLWECMATLQPPLQHANAQLLDAIITSEKQENEVLLHQIFASVGERTVPVKAKSSVHATFLEWLTYSQSPNSTWSLNRHRRFAGTTFPDYVTFEQDGQALHICAERTFDLVYDSLNPVTEGMDCGDKKTLEVSDVPQDVSPTPNGPNEAAPNSQLIKWTQPLSEERQQISMEIDLQRLLTNTDSFEEVSAEITPRTVDGADCQALRIHLGSGEPVRVLFDEALYGEIDPQLEFSVNSERKSLLIKLTKVNSDFWPRILRDVKANRDTAGPPQQSLCASEVEHLQEGSVATSNGDGGRNFVAIQPPFNIEQLEEVDFPDKDVDDDLLLQRIESTSSRVTHQANLCGHQWLFNAMSHRSGQADRNANTAVCLRHDVDGIVWLPVHEKDNFQWRHTGTLQAFGYVLASKRDRRFVSCPPLAVDSSDTAKTASGIPFVAVADNNKRIYIYRQPVSSQEHGFGNSDTELRKLRSEGTDKSRRVHVAWQHVVNLPEDGTIIGFVTVARPYPACLACTRENVYLMSLVS